MRTGILHDPQELKQIGQRIKQARSKLDISQKDLAKKLGIPPSILSDIEKGKRLVPKTRRAKFAEYLKLKEAELLPATASEMYKFRDDIQALENEVGIGFRELRALPEEAKQELLSHFKELKERYEKNNGTLPVKEKPADIAAQVLKKCRINVPPIDLYKIAKEHSIEIGPSASIIDADGWILYQKDKKFASIKYRQDMSMGRQRFTIAHELGHFFLQNLDVDEATCKIDGGQKSAHEREADEFASHLLMPEDKVLGTIGSKIHGYEDILKIAQTFEVSQQSAAIRLMRLSSTPAAVIYSEKGIIKWTWASGSMYLRAKRGYKVGRATQAAKIIGKKSRSLSMPTETKCNYWFNGRMNGVFMEHSSRLYKKNVLSLVWVK